MAPRVEGLSYCRGMEAGRKKKRRKKKEEMTYYCVSLNLFIIRNAFGRIDVISVIAALIGLAC